MAKSNSKEMAFSRWILALTSVNLSKYMFNELVKLGFVQQFLPYASLSSKLPYIFNLGKFFTEEKKLDVLCLPLLVGPVLENIWLRVMAIYFVGADWYVFASRSFLLTLFLLVVSTENQGKTQFRLVDHDTGPTIRRGKELI